MLRCFIKFLWLIPYGNVSADLHKTYLTSISKMHDFGIYDILKTHPWHIKNISDMTYLKHSSWIPETYIWHTKNIPKFGMLHMFIRVYPTSYIPKKYVKV